MQITNTPEPKKKKKLSVQAKEDVIDINREDLISMHEEISMDARSIMEDKNNDYAKDDTSPFANFELPESMGVCNKEVGIFIRLLDKMSRIRTKLMEGELQVEDESFRDTVVDSINYLILMYAASQDGKPRKTDS